jgi:hypothetical protein
MINNFIRHSMAIVRTAVILLIAGTAPACADPISSLIVASTGLFAAGSAGAAIATAVLDLGAAIGLHIRNRILRVRT